MHALKSTGLQTFMTGLSFFVLSEVHSDKMRRGMS